MTSREHLKDIADKTALYQSNYKPKFDLIDKDLEVLEILRNKPFILQKIFENKGLEPNAQKNYDGDYFWGTIDEEEYQKVKEWLENEDERNM